jgi:hypothetical protein
MGYRVSRRSHGVKVPPYRSLVCQSEARLEPPRPGSADYGGRPTWMDERHRLQLVAAAPPPAEQVTVSPVTIRKADGTTEVRPAYTHEAVAEILRPAQASVPRLNRQ